MSLPCTTCASTTPLQQIADKAKQPIIEALQAETDENRRATVAAQARPVPPAGQGQFLDRYA
jgi:hypothetical protein